MDMAAADPAAGGEATFPIHDVKKRAEDGSSTIGTM
jgi:hypothetical protein